MRKPVALLTALLLCALVACAAQTGEPAGPSAGQTGSMALPPIDRDLTVTATVPHDEIGEELPTEGLGAVRSHHWKAIVGGFTQRQYSEVLAFPPGTKIKIHNLSHTTAHAFDVVEVIDGPPAHFPKNPKLSFTHTGGDKLQKGYASGIIKPGHSVTVILVKGIYLIGCAFHYAQGMHDVLVVENQAKPGPQATPSPGPAQSPTPSPSPTSSTGPTATPTGPTSPTPSPSPTPMPIIISPSPVYVCDANPSCKSYKNKVALTVSLTGYSGSFRVNDTDCSGKHWATVTPSSSTGAFTVTGEGVGMWNCRATFSGGGSTGQLTIYIVNN